MTGLAARVPGQRDRSGVLVALTGRNRAFSDDEVAFSQAIANVLGATIDRNEAAEELRRRERELKVVVEHAADTIVRVDRQLRFLYLNPAAEQVMGFPASALIGRPNRVLPVAESLIDNWDLALRRAFRSGEEESFESMYPSPGGDRYYDE